MSHVMIDEKKLKALLDLVEENKSEEAQTAWKHGMELLSYHQRATGEIDPKVFQYLMEQGYKEKQEMRDQWNFRLFDNNKRKDKPNETSAMELTESD